MKLSNLLESLQIKRIYEQIELTNIISNILNKYSLKIPDEFKKYKSINLTKKNNDIFINLDDNDVLKIGKFLSILYPELKSDEVGKIVNDIKNSYKNQFISNDEYEFVIKHNNISKWYDKCIAKSCMNGDDKKHLVNVYDMMNSQNRVVSILLLKKDNVYIGRALLWHNIKGTNKKIFMDRVYPSESKDIILMFHEYAISNDWAYRDNWNKGNSDIKNSNNNKLFLDIENSWDKIKIMPFMDTFKYGSKNGLLSNIPSDIMLHYYNSSSGTVIIDHNIDILNNFKQFLLRNKNGSLNDYINYIKMATTPFEDYFIEIKDNYFLFNLEVLGKNQFTKLFLKNMDSVINDIYETNIDFRVLKFKEIIEYIFENKYIDIDIYKDISNIFNLKSNENILKKLFSNYNDLSNIVYNIFMALKHKYVENTIINYREKLNDELELFNNHKDDSYIKNDIIYISCQEKDVAQYIIDIIDSMIIHNINIELLPDKIIENFNNYQTLFYDDRLYSENDSGYKILFSYIETLSKNIIKNIVMKYI